jgi:hypothetical protein
MVRSFRCAWCWLAAAGTADADHVGMTASTVAMIRRQPLRTLRRAARRVALSLRLRSLAQAIACLFAVGVLSTLVASHPGSATTDIRGLTVEQRTALYQRTRANLELLCEPWGEPGLERYCREQARLLLHLPECDESCSELVSNQLGWATR